MLTYAIFLLVIFGGMLLFEVKPNENTRRNQLIFAWLIIVLFWGSVDARDFGTDIMNYYNNADTALNLSYSNYLRICSFERGYATFIWICSHVFRSPQALLFIQYGFVTFSVFRFIYRNSEDIFISVVTYLCLGSFGMFLYAFRQAFAIAICLIALELIQKRKRIFAVILILFASLFHQTAIVFLPTIFLHGKKLNQKNIFTFSAIMLVVALTLNYTLPKANELFEMNYGNRGAASALGGIITIIVYIISFVLIWQKYCKTPKELKETEFGNLSFIILLSIAAFVIYLCRFYALALERVAYYFLPAFCILFAEGLTDINKKRITDFTFFFVLLSVALFLYRSNSSLGYYRPIWRLYF